MARETIVIDPVTRIEGHAKITIHLDDAGEVSDARFHVTQLRGFEKLCEGRPFHELPSLMARVCGICPVSHLVASAKACDALLAVRIPEAAVVLRRILNLAQLVQSHALSFFHLSSPDLLLGLDAPAERRNLAGVLAAFPQLARDGIRLRQFGQQVIEWLGGKRVHPGWVVPGGVNAPLTVETRERILAGLPEMLALATRTLAWFKPTLDAFGDEIRAFANFPSLFVGLVDDQGGLEHYDGRIRVIDAAGRVRLDGLDPSRYAEIIGEAREPWSYLKSTYFLPDGYPEGLYRVGPLARLNLVERCGTPRADQEWAEFRLLERGAVLSSFHYHWARLIEIVFALERIEQLLNHPEVLSDRVRARAAPNAREGVGVAEAPRGLLIHHYRIDDDGLVQWANLVIATGHNAMAMNRGLLQTARRFVYGARLGDGALNRCEAVIRAFDPCLSCSTHALGEMPLVIELYDAQGRLRDVRRRDA